MGPCRQPRSQQTKQPEPLAVVHCIGLRIFRQQSYSGLTNRGAAKLTGGFSVARVLSANGVGGGGLVGQGESVQ